MNQEDKQFMSEFMIVLGALVVFTVIIFFLARYLMAANNVDYGPLIAKQVEERIEPAGAVATGKVKSAAATASGAGKAGGTQAGGEQVFTTVCAACHETGTAGAPMVTDKAAWQPRIAKGKQTLYDHAISGFNAMPPKGGDATLSNAQVETAVDYMVSTATGGGAGGKQQQAVAPAKTKQKSSKTTAAGKGAASAAGTGKTVDKKASADQPSASSAAGKKTSAEQSSSGKVADSRQQKTAQAEQSAGGSLAAGEKVYRSVCGSCHDSGVAGAPMLTDAANWKSRIMQGKQILYNHAINGFNAMPPKGGRPELTDKQVKAAVDYQLSEAQ